MENLLEHLVQFRFLRPLWLLAIIPLALLWWHVGKQRNLSSPWEAICDPSLLKPLLLLRDVRKGNDLWWLLGISWLLAIVALAGPTWSQQPQPVYQRLYATVIVLDLSLSMNAADLTPNRIVRARFKAADILQASEEGQVGLIAFAGDAFVVSPLTEDVNTIRNLLAVLEPSLMPLQGGRSDLALDKALALLIQGDAVRGRVVLITDASDRDTVAAAATLREQGFPVSVLGVGTLEGAPIDVGEGALLKDAQGNIVIPGLSEAELKAVARAGGGHYARIRGDGLDITELLAKGAALGFDEQSRQADLETEYWQEQGPWLILLLLPVVAFSFRRGWLLGLVLATGGAPPPVSAWQWDDLWWRRDQQVQRVLDAGQFMQAVELANDPNQRGTAAYRAGRFAEAVTAFSQLDDGVSHYNRGNALIQLGRFREAIAAYDTSLQRTPDLVNAKFNRSIAERLLQEQLENEQSEPPQRGGEDTAEDHQREEKESDDDKENSTDSGGSNADNGQKEQGQSGNEASDQVNDNAESSSSDSSQAIAQQNQPTDQPAEREQLQQIDEQTRLREEETQVLEQWLRRIPDDPGGLLRRKFLYQYQRRSPQQQQQAW